MVTLKAMAPAVALLCISIASAKPISNLRRDDDPLAAVLPSDTDRGVCVGNDYSSDESRKNVWDSARGSELIDAYLNQNDRESWLTDIWKKVFPEENAAQLDCWSSEGQCTINTHTCSDFDEKNANGFYQAFISVHFVFPEDDRLSIYLENLQDLCSHGTMMIRPIVHKFGRAEGEEPEPINVLAVLSGALSFGAGVGGNNPASASILGAMSGITSILSEASKDQSQIPSDELTEDGLWAMLQQTCTGAKERVLNSLQAVTGAPGSSEADIPQEMKIQYAEDPKYVHAISYLFGDGQWLVDHPTEGMAENFDKVETQLKQGMAWQMLKVAHQAVMVINDDSPCTDVNEVRDPDNGYYYGLMKMDADWGNVLGGMNDESAALWAKPEEDGLYMDKLTTYRNTLDCWLSNDANVGPIEPNADPMDTAVPECFFGMEVKKGEWVDKQSGEHRIVMDETFPNIHGQPGARGYWPDCDAFDTVNCL